MSALLAVGSEAGGGVLLGVGAVLLVLAVAILARAPRRLRDVAGAASQPATTGERAARPAGGQVPPGGAQLTAGTDDPAPAPDDPVVTPAERVVAPASSLLAKTSSRTHAVLAALSVRARVAIVCGSCAVVASLVGPIPEGVALLGGAAGATVVAVKRGSDARAAAARWARLGAAAAGAVDLLGAALMAGLNGHLALLRVAERVPPELLDEFRLVTADLRLGRTPADAMRGAAERTGLAELRAAAGALHAAERWGAPPAEALAARSEALRTRLRLEAEAAAGRAAVKLAFPLVFCFLPAFVLLTVVPLVAGTLRAAGF